MSSTQKANKRFEMKQKKYIFISMLFGFIKNYINYL